MAPKKKAVAKDGDVDLMEEFQKKYRKLLKEYEGVGRMPQVEQILQDIQDTGEENPSWFLTEEFDPMAYRLLMQALASSSYNRFKALRLWRCGGGDEAVRATCFLLDSAGQRQEGEGLEELQVLDCDVTNLGCSFLGRSLGSGGNTNLACLCLDFNQFGSAGMHQLSLGLSQNYKLQRLTLNFCGIDSEGGKFLFEILIFSSSALERLELRGNELERDGFLEVARGAKRARKLKYLDVADNKFGEDKPIIEALLALFQTNTTLETYNLVGNYITDVGAEKLIHGMIGLHHLKRVDIPQQCSAMTHDALETALDTGKGKGKKGKKGKKK